MGAPGKPSLNLGKNVRFRERQLQPQPGLVRLPWDVDTERAGQPLVQGGPAGYPHPAGAGQRVWTGAGVPEELEQHHGDSPCPPSTPEPFY